MNRHEFLKTVVPGTIALGPLPAVFAQQKIDMPLLYPPYLVPGDTIGITCPAGAIDLADAHEASTLLHQWGFRVQIGNTVGKHWMVFGGTDDERAADLQALINDPNVKAILSGRGGYGVMRILDKIDFTPLRKSPKWLIGYSDITALHCHVYQQFGLPTIHADMVNGLSATVDSSSFTLYELLTGIRPVYTLAPSGYNRLGDAEGVLVGGNLSMIMAMMGSSGEIDTNGKLLFIEDVREEKYTIDRMLMTLKRSGKLDNLSGLVIGGFTRLKEDDDGAFAMNIGEIIMEKVANYQYPVCFNFPAGHQALNVALLLGRRHKLSVGKRLVTMQLT